ncbi:MAG TPA: HEAT repeat domain-containing protein [Polyangia bacterium]|nr:HEAT repeat domain-containing protein [Polyangia bacterium]
MRLQALGSGAGGGALALPLALALRLALALPLALTACHRSPAPPPRPRVVSVEVADRSPQPVLDKNALTDRVKRALRKSGQFELAEPGADKPLAPGQASWRCRVEAAAAAERAGRDGMLHAMARVRCEPTAGAGAEALSAQALADQPLSAAGAGAGSDDVQDRLRALAERLAGDTVALLGRQQRLRMCPPAELLAALRDSDADIRRQAIQAAAFRRSHEAVPLLIGLLEDGQEDVRDMALGALTDIGDPAAVKAIVGRVKFGDVDELRKIIDPVAAMGGDEARAFLEFVASGHEDPEVRKLARRALEGMDRRAQTATTQKN